MTKLLLLPSVRPASVHVAYRSSRAHAGSRALQAASFLGSCRVARSCRAACRLLQLQQQQLRIRRLIDARIGKRSVAAWWRHAVHQYEWLGAARTPGADGCVKTTHRVKQTGSARTCAVLLAVCFVRFVASERGKCRSCHGRLREEDGCVTGRIEPAVACF